MDSVVFGDGEFSQSLKKDRLVLQKLQKLITDSAIKTNHLEGRWRRGGDIAIGASGLRFDSQSGQIGRSVAPLQLQIVEV